MEAYEAPCEHKLVGKEAGVQAPELGDGNGHRGGRHCG